MNPATGFHSREHTLDVPLDHADPAGPTISVFAREVSAAGRSTDDLPWLVFLQGGPGGAAPRPSDLGGWLGTALETHRVLLLDQRGTGRSTPVTRTSVAGMDPDALAAYLGRFRADSIVADAELFRRALGVERWDTLGQSYGGFLTVTYLSFAPHALRRCHITGGVPPLQASAEEVYRRTFPRVAERTREFYRRYPQDEPALRRIAEHLAEADVRLPDGDRLTVRRLRLLGAWFGMNHGLERLHWLLERAWDGPVLAEEFRYEVMTATGFVDRPIYALQEFIYGQGAATGWAAQRVLAGLEEFAPDADPLLLTGEMMFPWMFQEIRALQPFAAAAEILASRDDWPALYDLDRLARNEVPVAAAVYFDDLYVDAELSLQTAALVPGLRAWVTNEWEHDGLRASPAVFSRLRDMAAGAA